MDRITYVPKLHTGDTIPIIDADQWFDLSAVFPDTTDLQHASDPDHAQCPGCSHWWPIADLSHDRNGDNICPDCVFSWSAYPDHR